MEVGLKTSVLDTRYSEKLRIAQNIRESSDALFQLSTAIVVCDDKFQVLLINPAAQELFDAGDKLTFGESIFSFFRNPDSRPLLEQCLSTNQSTVVRQTQILDAQRREKFVDCILTPMSFQDSNYLILEFNEVDKVVRNFKKNTIEASQIVNSAVVRMMAHEIKNPLGGIRGAAQLLDRELEVHPDLREYTKIIVKETDRLCGLVDGMVGPQAPTFLKEVNIYEILEHVRTLAIAEGLAENQIVRDYDPSLPTIQGDAEQLIQVFVNIVRNALEATDDRIELKLRTRVQRHVNIGKHHYQRVAQIDIEDNGPGVPEEILDQIFCPMISGKNQSEGLGLSIVHQIITRHGGTISCESKPGQTCFTIFLRFHDHS